MWSCQSKVKAKGQMEDLSALGNQSEWVSATASAVGEWLIPGGEQWLLLSDGGGGEWG